MLADVMQAGAWDMHMHLVSPLTPLPSPERTCPNYSTYGTDPAQQTCRADLQVEAKPSSQAQPCLSSYILPESM